MLPSPSPLVDKGFELPGINLMLADGLRLSFEEALKLLPVIPNSLSFEWFPEAVFSCCLSVEIFSFRIYLTDYLNYPLVLLFFKFDTDEVVNC